jgi:hypothetical protein
LLLASSRALAAFVVRFSLAGRVRYITNRINWEQDGYLLKEKQINTDLITD